jgi:hypothetical protein
MPQRDNLKRLWFVQRIKGILVQAHDEGRSAKGSAALKCEEFEKRPRAFLQSAKSAESLRKSSAIFHLCKGSCFATAHFDTLEPKHENVLFL